MTLAEARAQWMRTVDQMAESARQQYLTPGAGQALVYEAKRREAVLAQQLAQAEITPTATDCPHLVAEATAFGLTVAQVAAAVLVQANAWLAVSPQIEILRLGAKAAIAAAATEAECAALAQVTWPTP